MPAVFESKALPVLRTRKALLGAAVLAAATLAAASALAGDYKGYGDTGWNHDNKRDCCAEAVWLAQEDSMRLCEYAGGQPRVRSGSTRGFCDWDAEGSGRDRVYRCVATANVQCR